METDVEIECLEKRPGNHWLAKVVLAAGTSCVTPSFPGLGQVISYAELQLPGHPQFPSIPESETLGNDALGAPRVFSPVETYLEGLIAHLSMPKSWIDEQIGGPTEDCKRYSFEVLRRLFGTYGVIPYKIAFSKDGGVFAAYKNPHNNRILRIEIDDDLDVVAVVSDGQAIVESGLLEGDDLERSLLASFDPQLARAFSLPRAPGSLSL
jgi:hypothetical protein